MQKKNLTLSSKIILILIFYIAAIISMGFVSYNDLSTTEKKIELLEQAYELHNIILEVRRYEKNFLLYHTDEALAENQRYLTQAQETSKVVLVMAGRLKVNPILQKLNSQMKNYRGYMDQLSQQKDQHAPRYIQLVDKLREQGKLMTDLSESLAVFERNQIHSLIMTLRNQLVSWGTMAVLLGIILTCLIIYFIFKPLSIIKKATRDIASGKFSKIEVINTRDEMQQVMEAFNTMVEELERRQDQLVQSEKLSSIGTLTAGVAHQLNNPLNNISTSCQIAMDELEEGDKEFLGRMLKNVNQETLRARDVVKGLLEFSRVQEFSLRPLSLAELTQKAVRLVQSQVPSDITLQTDIPEDLILPMDNQKMQEVFINLCINAVHSIEGAGQITLRAHQNNTEGVAIIEVEDTGHGIPEDIQSLIFDPFYTTKEEGYGTGLGLSVVYGIIQKHHGTITVRSRVDVGTTFVLTLPLVSDASDASE